MFSEGATERRLVFLKSRVCFLRETDGDDDIIFEDFARLRLKGDTDA